MTAYFFETITAQQAAAFTTGDTLTFSSTLPNQLSATYAPAAGTQTNTITLTNGTVTQTFGASILSTATKIFSQDAGSQVYFGDATGTVADTQTTTDTPLTSTSPQAAFGFAGVDTITVDGAGAHLIDAGAGDDSVSVVAASTSAIGAYVIQGGAGNDTLNFGIATGNLHVYGNGVANTSPTTDGNDTITVGIGSNYVNGNAGNDTISVTTGGATSGVNRLLGGNGNDTITGGDGVDSIQGNLGNDVLSGGLGDDYIRGGQGTDSLVGGAGNDQLFGDLGNDTLVGGNGADILTGGAGNDTFVFNYNAAVPAVVGPPAVPAVPAYSDAGVTTIGTASYFDTITDFKANGDADVIDLAQVTGGATAKIILATGATFTTEAAAQSYANGILTGTVANGVDNIVAIQVGADTYLFSHESSAAAGGAAGSVDTIIKLANFTATSLNTADFV